MIEQPQAVWFVDGTPAAAREYAAETVAAARAAGAVPVLVVYNVPGRDCGSYSDGGATTGAAYRAWIDAVVAGIGQADAVVVIEPDGLALLPTDCGLADTYDRRALIRYAAHAFLADANAAIYIDAGNSGWHTPGTIARRLVDVGVGAVDGFALNVSSYQLTANSNVFGGWVSKCIAYATRVAPGDYDACPHQYGWQSPVLSPFSRWSNTAAAARFNVRAENRRYNALLDGAAPTTRFVVDTSRNGRGPWQGTRAHPAGESSTEAWCNPPGRGVGARPTADTEVAFVDAYLWIKIPGESDGRCHRWTDGPADPARGIIDPAAGAWFPRMARELADNAVPSLP